MTIKYATNGKRDLHGLEFEFDNAFKELEAEKWKSQKNKQAVIDYLNACRRGTAKSGKSNKRINKATLYRILGILRILSEEWIKKDFDKTTQKDWDKFYNDMEDDKLFRKYKQATKAKTYKTLRKFLKWKFGENKFYPAFCENWVTTEEKTTKEFLTRAEIEKIVNAIGSIKIKCLFMMLFDGGFRIEELANLRWCDLEETSNGYLRASVRGETSKTKNSRIVSLLLSTDLIKSYKNSEKQKKEFTETNFLYGTSYNHLYKIIKRIGKKVLNKNISPHTLRHSSATYYAQILKTYQQFCSRYGWKLRSEAPQRYFHKVQDDETIQQVEDHEISKFRTDFEKLKIENAQMKETIREVIKRNDAMEERIIKTLSAVYGFDEKKIRDIANKKKLAF